MNDGKWKVNLNHCIFLLYKSVKTCHPVSLPCKGTNILIFATCGASFDPQVWSVQPPIQSLYPWVRCVYMHECSVHLLIRLLFPCVQINFYMQECFLHSLIPLLFSCLRCIYMQECSVDSSCTSSIPICAMSEFETCFEPV